MTDVIFENASQPTASISENATPVAIIHTPRRCWITLEPAILLITVGAALSKTVFTQLLLVRTCEVTLGYPSEKCNLLVNDTQSKEAHDIEDLVQPYVTVLQMYKAIIEACIPLVLSLFIGSWSDLHGRKPLIMWPVLGNAVQFATLAILSSISHLPPAYYLLASLPVAFSGGFVTVITGIYSYISDVTSTEKRAFRIGLLDCSLFGGFGIGTLISGPLFNAMGKYGYLTSFSMSCIIMLISFVYVIFLPESVHTNQTDVSRGGLCSIFDMKLLNKMVSTCCKKRENYGRPIIFLMMFTLSTCILTVEGESAVSFLYSRTKFGWDLSYYLNFTAFAIVMAVIGSTAGMYIFSLRLKISDSVFAAAVFCTKAAETIIVAFAPKAWYLYIGVIVGGLGGVSGPLCRSVLSKTVPQEDIGAVFSLTAMIEAVTPLAASPLYTLVYNATLYTFPGTYLLLSSGFFILDVVFLGTVILLQRLSSRRYSMFVNEEGDQS